MPDPFYPTVSLDFIEAHIKSSGKLANNGIVKAGTVTAVVYEGAQAIYKRTIYLREVEPGCICLEQATALALRFNFLSALMEWLENTRQWKEGAFVLRDSPTV